jgi:hypothetical protein
MRPWLPLALLFALGACSDVDPSEPVAPTVSVAHVHRDEGVERDRESLVSSIEPAMAVFDGSVNQGFCQLVTEVGSASAAFFLAVQHGPESEAAKHAAALLVLVDEVDAFDLTELVEQRRTFTRALRVFVHAAEPSDFDLATMLVNPEVLDALGSDGPDAMGGEVLVDYCSGGTAGRE